MENYTSEEQFGCVPKFKNVEAFLDDNVPTMTDKTKIYIDLSKCSEEQRKEIRLIIVRSGDRYLSYVNGYTDDLVRTKLHYHESKYWTVAASNYNLNKTELLYPDFIKLFEGGEDTIRTDNTQTLANAKALEEIRDIVAKNRGYENWETLNGSDLYDSDIDEVAKMYALQQIQKLEADKKELLRMLAQCSAAFKEKKMFGINNEIESLIQKHKQ